MDEVVIVSATRTAIGRFGGALRDLQALDLAVPVLHEAVQRAGLEPAQVDEVILGHVAVSGEEPNVSRQAALMADFPVEVTARGVERQCGSGLQAICDAVMQIQTGNSRIVVAGGLESMSNYEYYVTGARWGMRVGSQVFCDRWDRSSETCSSYRFRVIPSMMHTAANVAEKLGISREEQDEFALRSQLNAALAMEAGRFAEEIVPVSVPQKKGDALAFDRDEHPRPETTRESPAKLKPLVEEARSSPPFS